MKAKGTSFIFGGFFTSYGWNSRFGFKSDPNAFLFSLTNRDNQPSKMWQINTTKSIFCKSEYGPIFGSRDIHVCNDSNTIEDYYSNLGDSYHHLQPDQGHSYLPGSRQFKLSEIELYQKEKTFIFLNFFCFFLFLFLFFDLLILNKLNTFQKELLNLSFIFKENKGYFRH